MTRAETYAAIHGEPLPCGFFSQQPDYGPAFQSVGEERRKFVAAIEGARPDHPSLPRACDALATIDDRLAKWLSEWQPDGPAS